MRGGNQRKWEILLLMNKVNGEENRRENPDLIDEAGKDFDAVCGDSLEMILD